MKQKILPVVCIALGVVLLLACVYIAFLHTQLGAVFHRDYESADYEEKLDQLVKLLDTYYVDGYDKEILGDYLCNAAVQASGDRWSYYISAEEFAAYMEDRNNEYVGIGITVQLVKEGDKGITIMDVNPKGPAYKADLRKDDMIIAVEGQSVQGMTVEECGKLIKGEAGTEVKVTVQRGEKTFDVTVKRELIEAEVVSSELMGEIGYIRIHDFQGHSSERTIEAIETLQQQGATKLIFDVRFNPGGSKDELVSLLDYLLPEGPLFRQVNYAGEESTDYSDEEKQLQLPMAVLVNDSSYSAAEFFAAALQEYEWATVVGAQTVGKGNYQNTFPLADGSAVAISTGHYSTPDGKNLEGEGITPDIPVDVDEETYMEIYYGSLEWEEDPQLQAAIAALTE